MSLSIFVNAPFDASLLEPLYQDRGDLQLAAPRFTFPFDETEWTEYFSSHSENCSLIFASEGKTIGHTAFIPNGEDLFLCFVILLKVHRGQGLALEMIKESEEFCRLNYPHRELYLNVNRGNQRALEVYKNAGYEICEEAKERTKMKKNLYQKKGPLPLE